MEVNKNVVKYPKSWRDVFAFLLGALCFIPFIALADYGFKLVGIH